MEGGADLLLLETSQDTINVKAGLEGVDRAFAELGRSIPVAVQGTIEPMGTLLAGQDAEAFYTSLAHRDLLWIGFNCATGPDFMTDHIRTLAGLSRFPIACIPNAGLPDENGNYNQTAEMVSATIGRFVREGWLNVVGGCCGTGPGHITSLAETVADLEPRQPAEPIETRVSGIEALVVDEDTRPGGGGERTNVLGSRQFRRLIGRGAFEEASEVGRRQVRNGAHVLDVCLQDPDRDELSDVIQFLDFVTKKVKTPIMVDSTDAQVIEESLKRLQGKSIINSINLEDGEARFQAVVPLAQRYGAALVVGCIDDDKEQAQAITRERKLEVARRSHKLLTEKYGVPEQDIIFDPLVFPAGTGDENYVGSAAETIEGVRTDKGSAAEHKDGSGNFQRLLRAASGRTGSFQFGVPLSLRPSRAGHGDRQLGADAAVRLHPRRGKAAFGRPDLEPGRGPGGGVRGLFQGQGSQGHRRGTVKPSAGRAAGAGDHRGKQGGVGGGPGRGPAGAGSAGDHQRTADGGNGRSWDGSSTPTN